MLASNSWQYCVTGPGQHSSRPVGAIYMYNSPSICNTRLLAQSYSMMRPLQYLQHAHLRLYNLSVFHTRLLLSFVDDTNFRRACFWHHLHFQLPEHGNAWLHMSTSDILTWCVTEDNITPLRSCLEFRCSYCTLHGTVWYHR